MDNTLKTKGVYIVSSIVKASAGMKAPAKGVTGISPDRQRAIRNRVAGIVVSQLPIVKEVLEGKRDWTAAQVNLFRALLNKCIADQTAPKDDNANGFKSLGELSPEEFTRMLQEAAQDASGVYLDRVEASKVIDHE